MTSPSTPRESAVVTGHLDTTVAVPPPPAAPSGPSIEEYEKLIGGDTHDPHGILGAHPQTDGSTVIRTLRHHAKSVTC